MTIDEMRLCKAGDIVIYDGDDTLFQSRSGAWRLDERHNANGVAWMTEYLPGPTDEELPGGAQRIQANLRHFRLVG